MAKKVMFPSLYPVKETPDDEANIPGATEQDIPRDELRLETPDKIPRLRLSGIEYQLKRIGDAIWVIVALIILSWIIVCVVLARSLSLVS